MCDCGDKQRSVGKIGGCGISVEGKDFGKEGKVGGNLRDIISEERYVCVRNL